GLDAGLHACFHSARRPVHAGDIRTEQDGGHDGQPRQTPDACFRNVGSGGHGDTLRPRPSWQCAGKPLEVPMKIRARSLVLALVLSGTIGGACAQDFVFGWNPRTGDVWVDQTLGDINAYGGRYRESFIDE